MDRAKLEREVARHLAALEPYIGAASFRSPHREAKALARWVRRAAGGGRGEAESWAMAVARHQGEETLREASEGAEGHDVRELFRRLARVAEQTAATGPDPRAAPGAPLALVD